MYFISPINFPFSTVLVMSHTFFYSIKFLLSLYELCSFFFLTYFLCVQSKWFLSFCLPAHWFFYFLRYTVEPISWDFYCTCLSVLKFTFSYYLHLLFFWWHFLFLCGGILSFFICFSYVYNCSLKHYYHDCFKIYVKCSINSS